MRKATRSSSPPPQIVDGARLRDTAYPKLSEEEQVVYDLWLCKYGYDWVKVPEECEDWEYQAVKTLLGANRMHHQFIVPTMTNLCKLRSDKE